MDFVLERVPGRETHFHPIILGDLKVSIQAGSFHYCSPRVDMPTSDHYESFEVALILRDDWYHPERDDRFANTTWASYWSEYDDVAGHVPRSEVSQMLIDLRQAFLS